jgi:hypothetical protein
MDSCFSPGANARGKPTRVIAPQACWLFLLSLRIIMRETLLLQGKMSGRFRGRVRARGLGMTSHTIGAALVVAGVAWLIPAGIYAFCSLLRMDVNRRAEPEKPRNWLACIFKLFDLYLLMKVRNVIQSRRTDGGFIRRSAAIASSSIP